MNTAILFSIWLNRNCEIYVGAYVYNDKVYYIEDACHLYELFECFLCSEYYKKSIGTDTLLNDAKLLSESIDGLFSNDYHKASKLANIGYKAKEIISDMEGLSF